MRTRSGITLQQAFELHIFLDRLRSEKATTPELAHVLIVLREYKPLTTLREWCDGIAHKRRDRGDTALTGMQLLAERLQIDRFFAEHRSLKKIPKRVFEAILSFLQENDFGAGGVALKEIYPVGYSVREIVEGLRFDYQLDRKGEYYLFVRTRRAGIDSEFFNLALLLELIESKPWGDSPWHFDTIFDEILLSFSRLIGKAAGDILREKRELFTLHFLCCFHLTEVFSKKQFKHPCYLTVDHTISEHLSLNLAVYEREETRWEQMKLSYENRGPEASSSHDYSRPYLVTDLATHAYVEGELHDTYANAPYLNAVSVKATRGGPKLIRIRPSSWKS